MEISATLVKTLRDRTNLPMMECKKALTQVGGDLEKAIDYLRTNFKNVAVSRGGKETAEGRIAAFVAPDMKSAAIVEMRCESPPVVKAESFITLANDIAKQIATKDPANVEALLAQPFVGEPGKTVTDRINDVIGLIRENMKPARFKRLAGGLIGSYCHHDGSIGVLVQVEGTACDPQILRDVCMHITAKNPMAAVREEVPAEVIAKEKEIATAQATAMGKPANLAEKIAEGKLKTWFAENVLVEQPFVKDDSKSVGELLKAAGLTLKGFVRFKVGEVM
ncbi:MAG TPA: translation elongation factor Ts [Gemmataceae bacterium]|nr:translation elongation factor Ts [Gemmataceae bacterium]